MLRSFVLQGLLIAAIASVVVGCGETALSSDADSSEAATCKHLCKIAATLKCPNDNDATCTMTCEEWPRLKPECKKQIDDLRTCTAAQPSSDWDCHFLGMANVKQGVCLAENSAVVTCTFDGP